MYLKSLTLRGFKSFAQPTTFALEPGVTCIVGPNGSGKSNVVDALAWVMGEQGAKTLRGGKMEDVIFAGTSTRGPLGRAQVTLTIDNSDGALPIEYTEVTISRTLFRNGGSEYAINGESCRLLDVQELLSDTGLGREMHVIVGQGQLDRVLHATPEDRRGFIEEAAGILKHRRRKEKTVRKLEAMQTNLTRLSDLAGELRRQLKPLGRQAEVARRAQTVAAVARDAKARIMAEDAVRLRHELAEHLGVETGQKSERIVVQEQLEQVRLRQQHIEQTMVSDDVDRARTVVHGLESVQERVQSLGALARQRLVFLAQQAEAPEPGPRVTPDQVERSRTEAARLEAEADGRAGDLTAAHQLVATTRAELDALDEQIAAQSALVTAHDLEAQARANRVQQAEAAQAAASADLARRQRALADAVARADLADAALAALPADPGAEADETVLAHALEVARAAQQAAQSERDAARDALHALERERDALDARVHALALALDVRDGTQALISASRPGVGTRLSDAMRVTPGYEAAVAAALDVLVDAVVVDSLADARAAVDYARNSDIGAITAVLADNGTPDSLAAAPAGTTVAADVVTGPPVVRALLSRTLIVEADQVDPEALLASQPDLALVTRAGDILSTTIVRGGGARRTSRIEIAAQHEDATMRLAAMATDVAAATERLQIARATVDASRNAADEAERALRSYTTAKAAYDRSSASARATATTAHAEVERLEQALAESGPAADEAERALADARAAVDAFAGTPRPVVDATGRPALAAALEQARAAEIEQRIVIETVRERARSERDRAARLGRQLEAERQASLERARAQVVRRRAMATAESVLADLPLLAHGIDRSLAAARAALQEAETARAARNTELVEIRARERSLRERVQTIADGLHGLEMQIYEKRLHLSSLVDRVASELGVDESVLVAEYGPDQPVPTGGTDEDGSPQTVPYVRAEQERRLRDAERDLAQLGKVNPLALEEFQALEQRHAFLTEQLADLTKTRADLLTIIEELDGKMQAIFAAAFEDTRRAFDEVFPILFPGGSGTITLTDPGALLTTGVDVQVRPAGKKIDRLTLLSGGERSLAAIALLVAIFTARPSPFYIMDEVEAALDDANLGRLLTVFGRLRASSQLIVITHQKRTMEIADALYGVSMRQDGVSAVVGQRVQTREPAEAVA
ncbi:chromosome segregation protein SMC [Curtobacterium ammoniigenes]|uniref:chromosome segregation protein SMC n=1 Tax=Curtobacterium ammoniigenes TaxID=395387 RepID=UPI0008331044|nr:chromosome segregation protein SMC [Curtobacterium ammoniigenes]